MSLYVFIYVHKSKQTKKVWIILKKIETYTCVLYNEKKYKNKRRNLMLKEFKKFALKGNMIDLAVGIMIGAAFSSIVSSLVNDIIMPFVSIFTGKLDFTNLFFALDGKKYATLKAAENAGVATINYGTFITAVINFLIMAFVMFMLVKFIEKLKRTEKKEVALTTKKCPYCCSDIPIDATRCPHCTSKL